MFMLRGANCVADGPCSLKKYSSVPVFALTPPCFTSSTTPTIVNHGTVRTEPGLQALPNRALLLEERLRERLVDEDDRAARDIRRREIPPVDERDAHRLQVIAGHGLVVVDVLGRPFGRRGVAFEVRVVRVHLAHRREPGHRRDALHAGLLRQPAGQPVEEVHDALRRAIGRPGQHDPERDEAAPVEAGVDGHQVPEAPQQEARADRRGRPRAPLPP